MLFLLSAMAGLALPPGVQPAKKEPSVNSSFLQKNYPPAALRQGEQGSVAFEVAIEADGFLSSCKVAKSSGFRTLDRETCMFIAKHAKFPVVRTTDGQPVRAVHQGTINWRLPDGARRSAAIAPSAADEPLELICKRFRKSGTKVRYVRQCLTESEWNLQASLVQENLRELQDPSGTIPSGPDCRPRC